MDGRLGLIPLKGSLGDALHAPLWLRAKGDVFVITGPMFTDSGPTIGANQVKVPTYLHKLVYDATTQRAWAHWQHNRGGESVGPPISYQELVKRTGVEFLPRMAMQH